jgi:hypothetical protein
MFYILDGCPSFRRISYPLVFHYGVYPLNVRSILEEKFFGYTDRYRNIPGVDYGGNLTGGFLSAVLCRNTNFHP